MTNRSSLGAPVAAAAKPRIDRPLGSNDRSRRRGESDGKPAAGRGGNIVARIKCARITDLSPAGNFVPAAGQTSPEASRI